MTVQKWLGENNTLGIDIWENKYQRNNETFEEWLDRVSAGDPDVRQLILEKKFLFGGRILSNRGVDDTEEHTTYSNCYVISPPEDSIESIYETCKKLARTYSYGGGCGIDISKLSPAGAKVHNQARTTSGAVSFMDTFSQVTSQIGQNGRRGALMISMDCTHPDLEQFITVKSDLDKVTSANISVRISDDFMRAVEGDEKWKLYFKRPETGEEIVKFVRARHIFRKLCENNWNYAEPGILFWDRIKSYNLLTNTEDFEFAGTNPCAEEPLPAGGSCLLGSINLAEFINEDRTFMVDEFIKTVRIAVRALNDVLDEGLSKHPLEEQKNTVKDWRQIGLGIMGLADMLIKMGIRYGSLEAVETCDSIGYLMAHHAIEESASLHDGCRYTKCHPSDIEDTDFFCLHNGYNGFLANSQLLTIAPTGTISTMIGVSGGIEPIFANSYTRLTKSLHGGDVAYKVYTPIVEQYMKKNDISDEADLPDFFVTSADLTVGERIDMQGIWQDHIDASISSTVNLPNEATVEDVEEIYMKAWKRGLKGITVYRAGCAREGILTTPSDSEDKEKTVEAPCKDEKNIGVERHIMTGCGSLHICAFFNEHGDLKNIYLSKGSNGGCQNFMIALSRMISLSARNGVDIHAIVDQLNSSGTCPSYAVRRATKKDTSPGSSCPVAIAKALIEMWEEVNGANIDVNVDANLRNEFVGTKCPVCRGELRFEGGCNTCPNCGWSRCD